MRPESRYCSEAQAVERTEGYGYPTEVPVEDWVDHFDDHPEVYAALYAVVIAGWDVRKVSRRMHRDAPFHRPAPEVEDWVHTPSQRARRDRR